MKKRVLIIGGYGNFGSFITRQLIEESNLQIIIAGRSIDKANALAGELAFSGVVETATLDINAGLTETLARIKPDIVIHTSGPFQFQDTHVANACISQGCHYIDLADGRTFVENIIQLDERAREKGVLVISGASSVPCLTSALVDHYHPEFQTLDELDYGITTAQKTNRGIATTAAILSYTGKAFKTLIKGHMTQVFGWQNLHVRKYPELGYRLLGNCEVPDLGLFPERYPDLKTVRFYAGLELPFLHVTLWAISWLVRMRLIKNLEYWAPMLLKISYLFDRLGTADSGFHMHLSGIDQNGSNKTIKFNLTARAGDGPYIPCMPAILMARKLANGEMQATGAHACIGFISLDEYLEALSVQPETN